MRKDLVITRKSIREASTVGSTAPAGRLGRLAD